MVRMAHSLREGSGNGAQAEPNRKVFIQRDYSTGTSVKFQTQFPPQLEGLIDCEQFYYLIKTINSIYQDAEKLSPRTFLESCLACLSGYFVYLCFDSYYDKSMKKVAAFVDQQNASVWTKRGLRVTDPSERGLRVMEITIFTDKGLPEEVQ